MANAEPSPTAGPRARPGARRPSRGFPVPVELRAPYREDARYPAAIANVTSRCNLRCAHCFVYREGNPNRAPRSIREEPRAEDLLATLAALRDRHGIGSMLWMGGEPLLRRDVVEAGVRLFERNTVTTNGTVPLVDLGPDVLYVVSLDGPEASNDAIRGRGVFRRVLANLERLPRGFRSPVQVQCTVTRRNEGALEELVEALRGTRVGWITFSFYVPRRGDRGPDAWPDLASRWRAVERVLRLRERYPGFVRNSRRALALMHPERAPAVTARCCLRSLILPLYFDRDRFVTPFCCYGDDVDCERCGAWALFHVAARLGAAGGAETGGGEGRPPSAGPGPPSATRAGPGPAPRPAATAAAPAGRAQSSNAP